MGVCNPFKIKQRNEDRHAQVIDAHPDKQTQLSHQVLPIPLRMLHSLWDFGALRSSIEETYISSILADVDFPVKMKEAVAKCISQCQDFIRMKVEKNLSSVSLRDIQRVKEVMRFYFMVLFYRQSYHSGGPDFDKFCLENKSVFSNNKFQLWVEAVLTSLYLNYVYRIFTEGRRTDKRQAERNQRSAHPGTGASLRVGADGRARVRIGRGHH